MRKALVTGGAGFIGSHLCEALLAAGWAVRVLDDFSTGTVENLAAIAGQIEVVQGGLTDAAALIEAVTGVDTVFHLAAIASVPRSVAEPLLTNHVNLNGTLSVLEVARHSGVRRVVFASSCAAGVPDSSPYALQKRASELYCRLAWRQHGLETVALRYFNVYGPRQRGDYSAVIPRFIQACRGGVPALIHGDGTQTRDFVHVTDIVRANLLAAAALDAPGSIIDIGTGVATSVNDLLYAIQLRTPARHIIRPIFAPARSGEILDSDAGTSYAKLILGYEPTVRLGDGLRALIAERA